VLNIQLPTAWTILPMKNGGCTITQGQLELIRIMGPDLEVGALGHLCCRKSLLVSGSGLVMARIGWAIWIRYFRFPGIFRTGLGSVHLNSPGQIIHGWITCQFWICRAGPGVGRARTSWGFSRTSLRMVEISMNDHNCYWVLVIHHFPSWHLP
jgi:hypothetical protein